MGLKLNLEDHEQGIAAMKALIQYYASRSIWIIMTAVGFPITADYSRAQHAIFDESVIQKWKDYEAFSHGLQGTARVREIRNGKPHEFTFRLKQNRECALTIYPNNRDPLLSLCTLANPRYSARISCRKSDLGNAVLRDYRLPGDLSGLSAFEVAFIRTSLHFCCALKPLREAVSDPSFKVTKIVKETQNGQELIQIDYIYPRERKGYRMQERGSLWLDPSRCWCIRKSKLSGESTVGGERSLDIEREVACETIDHPSGFPILKSVTEQNKGFQHKIKRSNEGTTKTDYEWEVNDKVPDSDFTLTAFGLPEPGSEPVKKPIPLFVWMLVAAGVCAALAFGFRYLARRRARSQPVV
jgi:hypothetical protein